MTGFGSDDTVTTTAILARRRAQRAAKAAGGVAPVAVREALERADGVRDRYRQGGQGAPTLGDVVNAYGAVAPGEG